jgi:hypothetical protein
MWLTLYPTPIELREVLQYITRPAPEDEAFAKNLLRLAVSTLKYLWPQSGRLQYEQNKRQKE